MARTGDYEVVSRFLVKGVGWREEALTLLGHTYEEAGRAATEQAAILDARYGGDHFWTVDLYDHPHRATGSYYQLFHGRLS